MPRAICTCILLLFVAACRRGNDARGLDQKLLEASREGETNRVDDFLKQGAHIDARNEGGSTSLSLAVDFGHPQTAELLLQKGASLSAAGLDGDDALVDSARSGFVHRTEFLLRRNPTAQTRNEALFAVAQSAPAVRIVVVAPQTIPPPKAEDAADIQGLSATAAVLLTGGANLESRDEEGATPLIRAAEFGNTEVVKLLLDRGANVEAEDNSGDTALIAAACECASIDMPETAESLKLLIAGKADVNAKDKLGQTALMAAASAGETDNVRVLLDAGTKIDALDKNGNTALMLAASAGPYNSVRKIETGDSVKLLLARGADSTVRNKQRERAIQLAVKADRKDVVAVLKGAKKR